MRYSEFCEFKKCDSGKKLNSYLHETNFRRKTLFFMFGFVILVSDGAYMMFRRVCFTKEGFDRIVGGRVVSGLKVAYANELINERHKVLLK